MELTERKGNLEKMNSDLMDRNLRLQAAREDLVEKYLVGADKAKSLANQVLRLVWRNDESSGSIWVIFDDVINSGTNESDRDYKNWNRLGTWTN